jgi:hypothetical protein
MLLEIAPHCTSLMYMRLLYLLAVCCRALRSRVGNGGSSATGSLAGQRSNILCLVTI